MGEGERKKVLLATANADAKLIIEEMITASLKDVLIFHSTDGADAISKIANAPPHILILDDLLPKVSGAKIVEQVLKAKVDEKDHEQQAIIIIAPIPENEMHVDEVATGKLQYLSNPTDKLKVKVVVDRAIKFVTIMDKPVFTPRSLQPNEVLIKQGEKAETVFILRAGQLIAYVLEAGKEVTLGHIQAGEFVGEMAYINGEPRSANVKAVEPCQLIEIPIDLLDHVLFKKPAWAKALMKTLSKRVKAANSVKSA